MQLRPLRRKLAVVLSAGLVMGMLGGTVAASATVDELRDEISDTRSQIDSAKDELNETREQLGTVADQVRAADSTLAELSTELATIERQLLAAQADAEAAAERTAQARADLALLDAELRAAEEYLAEHQQILSDRVVSTFMYGSVSYADVVVESESVTDFMNTTFYLRTVLLNDKSVVDDVAELKAQLVEARTEADRLREVVEAEQRAADAAKDELASLAAAQERATAAAASERAKRANLHRQLEIAEAATEAEIAELAAESAALEKKLRKARWRAGAPGSGSWVWPTSGTITSNYGYRTHPIYGSRRLHAGVDIGAGYGTTIVAANEGKVVSAYCTGGGYGCRIVIDHGGGMASLYAHQSSFAVSEGTIVSAGQTIGYVGSTGASTGPHLHFEIRRNGVPENPMQHY